MCVFMSLIGGSVRIESVKPVPLALCFTCQSDHRLKSHMVWSFHGSTCVMWLVRLCTLPRLCCKPTSFCALFLCSFCGIRYSLAEWVSITEVSLAFVLSFSYLAWLRFIYFCFRFHCFGFCRRGTFPNQKFSLFLKSFP